MSNLCTSTYINFLSLISQHFYSILRLKFGKNDYDLAIPGYLSFLVAKSVFATGTQDHFCQTLITI
jgi:hypothetical protein